MRVLTTALAAAVLVLSACGVAFRNNADTFERTQPPSAWGKRPPPGHVEAEKAYVLRVLKDPESARFESGGVAQFMAPMSQQDPAVVPVWRSLLMVNAKSPFGGYTGAQPWSFLWHDGQLYRVQEPSGRTVTLRAVAPGPVKP